MRMTVREICNSVCRSSTNSAGKKNHRRHTKEHDHSSFYKFLQMEQNHKNTDCYFFYYSKCSKGDNCAFRHEPSALGCETVCSYWQQGNCFNEHCNFRHMELKKNRKSIPCYWEGQPSGCMKPHCPFLHINARSGQGTPNNQVKTPENVSNKPANQDWSNRQDESKFDASSTESDQGRGSSEAGSFIGSPVVDPLIVNFEEGTLSLPSSTLRIPGSLTLPGVPNSLNLPGSNASNNLSVPSVQNSHSSPCQHALSFPHHRSNLHHHPHSHGPSLSPMQNQSGSPFFQRPSSPLLQQPSSTLLQRPPLTSPIHPQRTSQPQGSRLSFTFLGFPSYRRF